MRGGYCGNRVETPPKAEPTQPSEPDPDPPKRHSAGGKDCMIPWKSPLVIPAPTPSAAQQNASQKSSAPAGGSHLVGDLPGAAIRNFFISWGYNDILHPTIRSKIQQPPSRKSAVARRSAELRIVLRPTCIKATSSPATQNMIRILRITSKWAFGFANANFTTIKNHIPYVLYSSLTI